MAHANPSHAFNPNFIPTPSDFNHNHPVPFPRLGLSYDPTVPVPYDPNTLAAYVPSAAVGCDPNTVSDYDPSVGPTRYNPAAAAAYIQTFKQDPLAQDIDMCEY